MNYNLSDKVVLITGANNPQGIGAATALNFVKEGAKVAIIYKKLDKKFDNSNTSKNGFDRYHKMLSSDASAVELKIKELTDEYLIIEEDITEKNAANRIFDIVNSRLGNVDILVNNAAEYDENDTIFSVEEEAINKVYNVNVKAALLLIKEFVKRNKNNGRIINISTDAAQRFAGQIVYGSSKAAMEALTRSIAIETGKSGITVNTIAPGPVQTGWIDEELEMKCIKDIPLGRIGLPEDISNAILFLASDCASWITGQVIQVSGGHCI